VIGRPLGAPGVAFVSTLRSRAPTCANGAHDHALSHARRGRSRGAHSPGRAVLQPSPRHREPNSTRNGSRPSWRRIEQHADAGLFHDELSDVSAPVLLTECLTTPGKHGLQFLSEAEYLMPIARHLTPEAKERLRPLEETACYWSIHRLHRGSPFARPPLPARPRRAARHRATRPNCQWACARRAWELGGTGHDRAPRICRAQKIMLQAKQPAEKVALLELARSSGTAPALPCLARNRPRATRPGRPCRQGDFEPALRRFLVQSSVPGSSSFPGKNQPGP